MNLCVIDFGTASFRGNDNLTERVGTPGYIAPEVFRGENYKGT